MRRTYRILTRIFTACFLFFAAAAFSLSGVALTLAAAVLSAALLVLGCFCGCHAVSKSDNSSCGCF